MSAADRATDEDMFSFDKLETVDDDDVVHSCTRLMEIDQELRRAKCILESDRENLDSMVRGVHLAGEAEREMMLKNRVRVKLKEIKELNYEMTGCVDFLSHKLPREMFECLCERVKVTRNMLSRDLPQSSTCIPRRGNRETSRPTVVERKFNSMNTDRPTKWSDRASGSVDSRNHYSSTRENSQLKNTPIFDELKALQHPGMGVLVQKIVRLKHTLSSSQQLMQNDLRNALESQDQDDVLWLSMHAKLREISKLKYELRKCLSELRKKLGPDLFNRYCKRYRIVEEDYEADGEVNRQGSGASLLYLRPVAVDSNPQLANYERTALKHPDVAQLVKSILGHKRQLVPVAELLRRDLRNLELGTVPPDLHKVEGKAPGISLVLQAGYRQVEVDRLRCAINKFVADLGKKTSPGVFARFCDCYRVFSDNWNNVEMDTTIEDPYDETSQEGEVTANVAAVESQIRAKNRTFIDASHSLNPTTRNRPSLLLPGTRPIGAIPPVPTIFNQLGAFTDPSNLEQVKMVVALKHQLAVAEKQLQADLQYQTTGVIPADLVQINNMTIIASMQVRIQSTQNTVDYLKRTISDKLSVLRQVLPSEMFNRVCEPLEEQAINPGSCQQHNKIINDVPMNPVLTANVDWRPVLNDIAALDDPFAWCKAKNVEKLHQRLSFAQRQQQQQSQLLNENQSHVNDVVAKINAGLVAKINQTIESLKCKLPPALLERLYNCCWHNVEVPDSGRLTVEDHKKAENEVDVLLPQSKQDPGKKRVAPCDPEVPLKRQFLTPADPLQQLLHNRSVVQNIYNKTEHYSQSEHSKHFEDDTHENFPSRQSIPLWTRDRKAGVNSVNMQKRSDDSLTANPSLYGDSNNSRANSTPKLLSENKVFIDYSHSDLSPGDSGKDDYAEPPPLRRRDQRTDLYRDPVVQDNRRRPRRRPSGDEYLSSRTRNYDDDYSDTRGPFSDDFHPETTSRYADYRSALDDEYLDTSQKRERRTRAAYLDSNVERRSGRTSSDDYYQFKSSRRSDYRAERSSTCSATESLAQHKRKYAVPLLGDILSKQ